MLRKSFVSGRYTAQQHTWSTVILWKMESEVVHLKECFQYLIIEVIGCYNKTRHWSIWSRIKNAHYLRDTSNTHVTDTYLTFDRF